MRLLDKGARALAAQKRQTALSLIDRRKYLGKNFVDIASQAYTAQSGKQKSRGSFFMGRLKP